LKTPVGLGLIFIAVTLPAVCQVNRVVKKDLQAEWQVHAENRFVPYNKKPAPTIYFTVEPEKFKGDFLLLQSAKPFAVFLNGKLIRDNVMEVRLPVDSLARSNLYNPLRVAIHQQPYIHADLVTQLISETQLPVSNPDEMIVRHENGLRNFLLAVSVMLLVFLLLLFRYNPKLVSDYVAGTTFLSLRESDDHPMFNRIGNTTNVFAYVLTALLAAAVLMHMPLEANLEAGEPDQFTGWIFRWLLIGAAVLALLFCKAMIIFIFSLLFNISDLSGYQFFNFIRFLLFVFGLLLVIMVVQFFSTGSHFLNTEGVISGMHYLLLAWVVLSFLKLVNKVSHTAIHLFLYICATEIIPFLIIIKVYK
jgi:hypothetical protein